MNSTLQNFTGLPLMPKLLQNQDMDTSAAERIDLATIGYELVSLSSWPWIPSSSVSPVPSLTHDLNKQNFDH